MEIREVKQDKPDFKVKEVDSSHQIVYEFTCKMCGGHSANMVSVSQSKHGGYDLTPEMVKVCRNCNYTE